MSQQLTETTVSLEMTRKQSSELQEKHDKIMSSKTVFKSAELTTKLQKPRLNAQNHNLNVAVNRLFTGEIRQYPSDDPKGMSIEEIAAVLAISTHEAQQLVNLSKMAQGNLPDVAG